MNYYDRHHELYMKYFYEYTNPFLEMLEEKYGSSIYGESKKAVLEVLDQEAVDGFNRSLDYYCKAKVPNPFSASDNVYKEKIPLLEKAIEELAIVYERLQKV